MTIFHYLYFPLLCTEYNGEHKLNEFSTTHEHSYNKSTKYF